MHLDNSGSIIAGRVAAGIVAAFLLKHSYLSDFLRLCGCLLEKRILSPSRSPLKSSIVRLLRTAVIALHRNGHCGDVSDGVAEAR